MANYIYTNATKIIGDGTVDWDGGGAFFVALTTSGYTPDVDADMEIGDITNELAGGDYARVALTNLTVTKDDANNRTDYGADNVAWAGLTNGQTAAWAVIYFRDAGLDTHLIACCQINSGAGVEMTGDVELKWNNTATAGTIFRITAS